MKKKKLKALIMLQEQDGMLEGGFVVLKANLAVLYAGETTNNCNGGNCAVGCNGGQNSAVGCSGVNIVAGCGSA